MLSQRALVALVCTLLVLSGRASSLPSPPQERTNLPGKDYRSFELSSPDPAACQKACQDEAQCQAWTYVKPGVQGAPARCWLKSEVPPAVADDCCTSGLKAASPQAAPRAPRVSPEDQATTRDLRAPFRRTVLTGTRDVPEIQVATNLPGMDYRSFELPGADPAACQKACEDEAQCRAWTYVRPGVQGPSARCWLKSDVPPTVKDDCCVSGTKGAAAVAKPAVAEMTGAALLPQLLARVRSREYAPGRSGPTATVEYYMFDRSQRPTLTYEIIDGLAIFEGDMILGRVSELQAPRPVKSARMCVGDACPSQQALSAIFGETYRWPGGVIPFEFGRGFSVQGEREIWAGIDILTASTNLLLRSRRGERDYIVFVPSDGCSSHVGRKGGRQDVYLADGHCGASGVAHEILHAAGLWHEQSRSDRDRYIKVLWDNIEGGKKHNFEMHASDGIDIGPYDLQSIMHYWAAEFGKVDPATNRPLPTIETIPPGLPVGDAGRLTVNDIAGIRQLYPVSQTDRFVAVPGLVFALRHSMNQASDQPVPFVEFGHVVADRIHGGDRGAPSGEGFNWWTIPASTPLSVLSLDEIPPGVVMGLWHSQNMSRIAGDPRLATVSGGDLGAPSGEGFVWYENADIARVNWDAVDLLPPYTVVGLKHSQNQRDKRFVWKDGQTYDPLVGCPDGFDRKDGGDRGASSGTGYYWCEKRR